MFAMLANKLSFTQMHPSEKKQYASIIERKILYFVVYVVVAKPSFSSLRKLGLIGSRESTEGILRDGPSKPIECN
jgi:hypothetical protein